MTPFQPALVFLACVACADTPRLESTSAAIASIGDIDDAEDGCPVPVCGNAAKLGGPFGELDMSKTDFSPLGHYRIKTFSQGLTQLTLQVNGFDVTGITPSGKRITNAGLKGAIFVIEEYDPDPGDGVPAPEYAMKIADVGSIPFVEGGNVRGVMLPTFKLVFNTDQFVCPGNAVDAQLPFERHALLFTGNRYSQAGAAVASGAEADPWFNIACKNTAEWKAALFRLVAVAETPAFRSDPIDYTAAVRSIRADYCGNGLAHTVYGQQVEWVNRGGWLHNDRDDYVLEAVWGTQGAVCLNQPRIDGVDRNHLECAIPECSSSDEDNWIANGHLMATWVPAHVP